MAISSLMQLQQFCLLDVCTTCCRLQEWLQPLVEYINPWKFALPLCNQDLTQVP